MDNNFEDFDIIEDVPTNEEINNIVDHEIKEDYLM